MRMRLSAIGLVYAKELRETLRDRRTIIVMILFPLVVYPLLSMLAAQVLATKEAKQEARASRVAVSGPEEDTRELRRAVEAEPKILQLVPSGTRRAVETGEIDALVAVQAGKPVAGSTVPRSEVEIVFDATREESQRAKDRLDRTVSGALPAGCAPRFAVTEKSVAPRSKMGGYVLSKILPLMVILMVVLGAFYPAIDVTAGERERGTLETILSAPIDRFDLMAGKVLAVATLAALSGVLNLGSMSLTLAQGIKLAGAKEALVIPWGRAAATLMVILPASFLFGSVMVAVGSIARSFKEAQNLLTPVYFLCFMPAMVAALGEYPLQGVAALVPGVNVTLLARDIILDKVSLATLAVVLGSTLLYGGIALALAARLYDSERLLYAAEGNTSLGVWIRRLVWGSGKSTVDRRPSTGSESAPSGDSPGQAILLFGIAFVLLFFVFLPMQEKNLVRGLLVSQWGGYLVLALLAARASGRSFREAVLLRIPTAQAISGSVLIGASAWAVLGFLSEWLLPVPKEVTDRLRDALVPPQGGRSLAMNLLLVALTPAICEEALFRGPILRGFAARFPAGAAALLTGALFGIFHVEIWRVIPTGVLGVLLSWVALRTGSIVPAMLVHFISNATLVTLAQRGGDDALSTLSVPAQAGFFAVALAVLSLGCALVRRSAPRQEGPVPEKS